MAGSHKTDTPEMAAYKEAFSLFDTDNDGFITKQELGAVLKSLQINATDSEIEDMINEVDLDQTGTIDLEEFIKMMKIETKPSSFEQEMRSAFKVFDSDDSGHISVDELRKVMSSFGEALSEEEIKIMIQEVDKNGDGQIDYEEFVKFFLDEK
ncbi:hypothetical protein HYALB_00013505 [Hymenoscyphus albidus]|uniref:Calmodulin n=2 Tax=Hymenoscyphus TaxID=5182 RepID=A0A9N9L8P2_9HELO|nr:hypothetical protein HYFRA_00014163 [Hymenoscyphus fraxineus]CAG8980150.1 hypothetical protein HYALB_00013505 [Hymenoscyphus albidus]